MAAAHRLAFASMLATAIAAGCTLFTSLDGLSGGAAAGASDAGASDAAAGDSASDAGADGSASDAGADGAQACAPPSFCDDFERADPRGPWDNSASNGGSMAIDTTQSHSPTRSLRVDLASSSSVRGIYLQRLLSANRLGAKVSFFVRFESVPAHFIFMSFQLNSPLSSVFFGVEAGRGLYLTEQNYATPAEHSYELGTPTLGGWDKITVEVRRSAATAPLAVRVTRGLNDTVLVDEAAPITLGSFANYSLGVGYAPAGTDQARVWFDDVRVDLE